MQPACPKVIHKSFAEFIGTFILVFMGTGAVMVNSMSSGVITHVGIALVFGMVVTAIIYAAGDLSGAHINPAVTIAFCVARRECWCTALYYIPAQILGAVGASFLLRLMLPDVTTLGQTVPGLGLNWWATFAFEFIFSLILMVVILNVSTGAKEKGVMAGVAVGFTVCILAMVGGPLTGASMNPARSIGPQFASGQLEYFWLYLLAPLLGTISAVAVAAIMRKGYVADGLDS